MNQSLAGLGVRSEQLDIDGTGTACTRRGPRRQAQLPFVARVLRGAPRPVPRDLHGRDAHRADPRGRHVHDADVLHHRRIPPLLLAQELPTESLLAVPARVRRDDGVAEGSAVVGRAPPQPSPLLRHRTRRALAQARILVEPRRLDPLRQVQPGRHEPDPRLREVSRRSASSTSTTGSGRGRSRCSATSSAGGAVCVIGFFLSTVVLWHVTFTVNSVAHVMGRRAYETDDTSRNTLLVALATGGEGWHNNHHRYPWSARQGFRWWQIDMTYYVLRGAQLGRHRPRSAPGAPGRHRGSARRQGSRSSFGYFSPVSLTSASVHTG